MSDKTFQLVDMDGNPVQIDLAKVLSEINKRIIIHPLPKDETKEAA